jgi:hypothetical protein
MPRVRRIARRRNDYTDQEHRVLLTGVPISPVSTRFGHPRTSWNIDEIRVAWNELGGELRERWESPEFAYHRGQHSRPFAERLLVERRTL